MQLPKDRRMLGAAGAGLAIVAAGAVAIIALDKDERTGGPAAEPAAVAAGPVEDVGDAVPIDEALLEPASPTGAVGGQSANGVAAPAGSGDAAAAQPASESEAPGR